VAKLNFKYKRPELSIEEVLEQYECSFEDLIQAAATEELTLYVQTDEWKVEYVCSASRLVREIYIEGNEFDFQSDDVTSLLPELINIKDAEDLHDRLPGAMQNLMSRIECSIPKSGFQEIVSNGMFTFYPNTGKYQPLYLMQFVGLQPISSLSAALCRLNQDSPIFLKFMDLRGLFAEHIDGLCILPRTTFSFSEARMKGKLFVMKEDLDRLTGIFSEENLSVMYHDPKWPEELGIAIAAWQYARDNCKEGDKPKSLIEGWLNSNKSTANLSDAAINRITTIANWDDKPGPAKK
jgi:hypothetical protein